MPPFKILTGKKEGYFFCFAGIQCYQLVGPHFISIFTATLALFTPGVQVLCQ